MRQRGLLICSFLLLTLGLASCQRYPEENSVDLLSEFPLARQSNIVAGQGSVGRPPFRSYLGAGLRPDLDGDWARATSNGRVQAFGFFLYQARPLSVVVTGKSAVAKSVEFRCGGRTVGQGPVASELAGLRLSLSQDSVVPGMNWIEVENAEGVAWRDFRVFPSDTGLSISTGLPLDPEAASDGRVRMPFGQTVSYALQSSGSGRLLLDWKPWVESGAAEVDPEQIEVQVRAISESGEQPRSWTLRGGGGHQVDLPAGLGDFGLELSPRLATPGGALPGQIGVEFSLLSLQRSEPEAEANSPPEKSPSPVSEPRRRPNVVLLVVDTLRADRLGAYGYERPVSPHFDALATDSVLFPGAFAEAPWTKPSVATILTGLEAGQHGVHDFNDMLEEQHQTLAEELREAGYQTFGVIANPLVGSRFGFGQGFDSYTVLPVSQRSFDVNRKALEQLEKRSKDTPFFLYLQPIDPHLPYDPPQPFRTKALELHGLKEFKGEKLLPTTDKPGFTRLTQHLYRQAALGLKTDVPESTRKMVEALYDGEVATADAGLGELVAWLKKQNLYEETVIIVTSDHGEELIDRDWLGHMHTFYEELVHVPMLMKLPHGTGKGTRYEPTFHHRDILPTVLAKLGLKAPNSARGISYPSATQQGQLSQMDAGRDAVQAGQAFSEFLQRGTALRQGDLKLIHHDSSVKTTLPRGLFDLSTDPLERENLLFQRPVTALRLERELALRKLRYSDAQAASKGPSEVTRSILESLQYVR